MLTLAGQDVSALEVVAVVSGLASVWLAQRMHIGNWLAGMVSVLCLAFVFFGAKLYADSVLQLVLLAFSAYGWWHWAHARGSAGEFSVTRASAREIATATTLAPLLTWAVASALMRWTDSPVPWPDAAILAFSLVALWAQAHRRVECWLVWIGVDLIAIPLYWSRSLPLTAALYALFLLLCVGGWLKWERRRTTLGQVARK